MTAWILLVDSEFFDFPEIVAAPFHLEDETRFRNDPPAPRWRPIARFERRAAADIYLAAARQMSPMELRALVRAFADEQTKHRRTT